MANAIKCTNCGKFEEGLGYSVRIYQHIEGKDSRGNPKEFPKRLITEDCLCYECASNVATSLNEVLIPEE